MKPNFALNLSHDGISLLHRAKTGWMPVGEVRLDSPSLNDRLEQLRRTAIELDQTGLTSKLIIPTTQILFTELDAPGPDTAARETQIREGLVGLTPYSVGDLIFDYRVKGDRVDVAVVARETLREAEAFAAQFKFNPVSFVGAAGGDQFSGEPFFGTTGAADTLLEKGDIVVPDEAPARPAGPTRQKPKLAPIKLTHRSDVAAAPIASSPPQPAERDRVAAADPKATKPDRANKKRRRARRAKAAREDAASPVAPVIAEPSAPDPKPAADPAITISFTSRRNPSLSGRAPQGPSAPVEAGLGLGASAEALYAAPPPALDETESDDIPPMPSWQKPVNGRRNGQGQGPATLPVTSGRLTIDQKPVVTVPPAPVQSAEAKLAAMPPPTIARRPTRREAIAASSAEAKAMTVFGERAQPVPSAKPRYLGLTLTILLLLAFGVAALWSSLFRDEPVDVPLPVAGSQVPVAVPAASTGSGSGASGVETDDIASGEDTALNAAAPEPSPTDVAPSVVDTPPVVDTARVQPAPGEETFAALPSVQEAPLARAPPAGTQAPAPEQALNTEAAPPAEPILSPEVEAPVTSEGLPPPDRVLEAPPTVLEAERRYAATGIWQLDPEPLAEPIGAGQLGDVQTASVDATLSLDRFAPLPETAPDSRPGTALGTPPSRLRASFDLDERGLVAATPDGNLSPDGTLVYLGSPPLAPGVRPGTAAPIVAPPGPVVLDPLATETQAETQPETASEGEGVESASVPDTVVVSEPLPSEGAPDAPVNGEVPRQNSAGAAETAPPFVPGDTTAAVEAAIAESALADQVAEPVGPVPTDPPEEEAQPLPPELEEMRRFLPVARPGDVDETSNTSSPGPVTDIAVERELARAVPGPRPLSAQEISAEQARAEAEADEADAAQASELAIAASRLPARRPNSVAERAEAARAEASPPETEAESTPEPDIQVAAAVVPSIPSRATVSRAATEENVLRLNAVNLIGVYGAPSERRALVRLRTGRYVKVEVGDRVDGGRVAAIGQDELRYVKGGRNITLKMPRG